MLRFLRKLFFDETFQKKKAFLRTLELFKDLSDRDLAQLAQTLHSRTYQEGEVIFVEGDIGRALFVLESGQVDLTMRDPSGAAHAIYAVKPGEFFGEMALLEQLPRTASATSAERSRLYLLYRSKLDALLHRHPRIGVIIMAHLAQILSARLRRTSNLVLSQAPPKNG